MDDLPQEIIDQISSHLDRFDLRSTLTVNSKFQASSERYCGAYERFDLEKGNVNKFLRTFSGRHFRHLRRVFFPTTLVPDDIPPNHRWLDPRDIDEDDVPRCRESKETLQEHDRSWSAQIRLLFDTLNMVERSVGDAYGPGKISLTILTPTMELDPTIYCPHRAHVSSRVHLLDPKGLPALNSIRRICFRIATEFSPFKEHMITLRKPDDRVMLDIAYKLPNLERLACQLGGDEWPTPLSHEVGSRLWHMYQGPRRDSRHDFAQNLDLMSLPTCLREISFNFIYPLNHVEYIDQRIPMPNLTAPSLYDPFSNSLRMISYQLRRMDLFAVVDETLFWPIDSDEPPIWPSLEILDVGFHIVSPSGKWYFKGMRDAETHQSKGYELDENAYPPLETTEDDEYWCSRIDEVNWDESSPAQFRVVPDDEAISPFLEAFARAAARMPNLKVAVLWCPLILDTETDDMGGVVDYEGYAIKDVVKDELIRSHDLAWGIVYSKPNRKPLRRSTNKDVITERQLGWLVGNRWRPSSHLHEQFQQIGREKYGDGLVEHWNDEYFGDGLVERGVLREYPRVL